jgi:DNA-binding ferritin-like protein
MHMAAKIDIGIKDEDRKTIADGLSRLLADTYTLYLKTHNFHWNVTGPMFQTLHPSGRRRRTNGENPKFSPLPLSSGCAALG